MYATSITTDSSIIDSIIRRLDCNTFVAELVKMEMDRLRARGDKGQRPFEFHPRHDRRSFLEAAQHPCYCGADEAEIADMFTTAWLDGIQRKDRLTVELDSTTADAVCARCDATLSNGMSECDSCGSHRVTRYVDLTVRGPYAALWAEAEPYVEGSSWEEDGPHFVWTRLADRAGLADELEEDGYVLDRSSYSEEEEES